MTEGLTLLGVGEPGAFAWNDGFDTNRGNISKPVHLHCLVTSVTLMSQRYLLETR
ncbi:hypothetical protein [Coleofasciculus sp. H7-2]|uniref:hypothetical protein n=1 Tax=Coleofasciculus sp. H7-2 TaxID=3351545 RepID=UPI003671F350